VFLSKMASNQLLLNRVFFLFSHGQRTNSWVLLNSIKDKVKVEELVAVMVIIWIVEILLYMIF
jgi:hypothetical protein